MMAQSRAESTRDTYNYGQYLNQFPPNTIKVIREFERIQKRIFRHKMSIMFNEICIYIYINLSWPTVAKSDPKTPFSITTTPRCKGGHYLFSWIVPLTPDPYLIMLSVKQGGIKYHFWVFDRTRPGIERQSNGPLANTLTLLLMDQ